MLTENTTVHVLRWRLRVQLATAHTPLLPVFLHLHFHHNSCIATYIPGPEPDLVELPIGENQRRPQCTAQNVHVIKGGVTASASSVSRSSNAHGTACAWIEAFNDRNHIIEIRAIPFNFVSAAEVEMTRPSLRVHRTTYKRPRLFAIGMKPLSHLATPSYLHYLY